jgi:hypothetical protein
MLNDSTLSSADRPFSAAPYLTNARSHHRLKILDTNDKAEDLTESFSSISDSENAGIECLNAQRRHSDR